MLRSIPALTRAEWLRLSGFGGAVALLHLARLGALPLLRPLEPGARRARHARVHLRAAARVRRRPHRGDRQHDAQVPAGGEAPARRRLLLLARSLERRARAHRVARARRGEREGAHPVVPALGRLRRRGRVRDVPLDHRDPQPARPARHRPRLPRDAHGQARRGAARAAPARPRPDVAPLHRPRREPHPQELADVPARRPVRARLRHRDRGRPARDLGRRRDEPRARSSPCSRCRSCSRPGCR